MPPTSEPERTEDERDDRRASRCRRRRASSRPRSSAPGAAETPGPTSRRSCRPSTSAAPGTCTSRLADGCGEELEQRVLLGRHVAARPRHLLDRRRSRPIRSAASTRFQPGLGTNESIEKPFGRVRTIFVVVRVLLLGRDREAVELQFVRQRDRRAHARVRRRARDGNQPDDGRAREHAKRLLRFNSLSFRRGAAAGAATAQLSWRERGGPRRPRLRESGDESGGSGCAAGNEQRARRGRTRGGHTRARRRPRRLAVRSSNRAAK